MSSSQRAAGGGATRLFAEFSSVVAKFCGRPPVFFVTVAYCLVWASLGPFFHFSDTWQLVINTTSSIVTFVMVFLIQNTQARDSEAVQAKLDELLHAIDKADSRFIGIERLPDKEIEEFRKKYRPEEPGQG